MTNQNNEHDLDGFQHPQRISWKRHLELEAETVEQLRKEIDDLTTDTDHYYSLVCQLAKDLQDHGVDSKALAEVQQMGWLETVSENAALTDEQLRRQEFVDNTIHAMLIELTGFEFERDSYLIGTVRDCVCEVFSRSGIMSESEFYPFIDSSVLGDDRKAPQK